MNFELQFLSLDSATKQECDLLIVPVSQECEKTAKNNAKNTKKSTNPVTALIKNALEQEDFSSKAGQVLHIYQPQGGISARRLVLVGSASGAGQDLTNALGAGSDLLQSSSTKHAIVLLTDTKEHLVLAMQTLAKACYSYGHTKSAKTRKTLNIERITLCVTSKTSKTSKAALNRAFALGQAIVAGQNCAKEWGDRPANHATPTMLAEAAEQIADQLPKKMRCIVHDKEQMLDMGMGAFLAVTQGSHQAPKLIELRYEGAGNLEKPTDKTQPVVLVGKGITFDTGGICLKPAAGMDEMKFDMCGAASVLGVFQALALLQPKINVVGIIASCENMPSGTAVKPGDVVTSMSGQTIEILNTDAEGRLVLCDALTYAQKSYKPKALIDIATLTGACVIALGAVRSGMYANDDKLSDALSAAGKTAQDLCWRMPLDDDYGEGLKTNFADIANVAGREAGSVTAAKFLQRFVEAGIPWAHLDIAGTAWRSGKAKGATGRPVALLVNYLNDLSE